MYRFTSNKQSLNSANFSCKSEVSRDVVICTYYIFYDAPNIIWGSRKPEVPYCPHSAGVDLGSPSHLTNTKRVT